MANEANKTKRGRRSPPYWEKTFLDELAKVPNVSRARRIAKVSAPVVYARKNKLPGFAKKWDAAIAQAVDRLHERLYDHAVEGVEKPVFQGGKLVGYIREWDNAMSIRLLEAHDPRFSQRHRIDGIRLPDVNVEFGGPEDG